MYFIDFHSHIYPDAIAPKAADSIREFYHLGNDAMDGRAETLLERGTKAGIEKFVILPVALRPSRTRHINDFILNQVAAEPRFYGYGTIHAGMDNACGEVEYIMEKGLRGLKMHPDSQVFAIDDFQEEAGKNKYFEEISYFINCIRTGAENEIVPMESTMQTIEIVTAEMKSAETRTMVYFEK